MSSSPPTVIRPLDPEADRRQLAPFSCRDFRYPWTDVIEEMVQGQLAASIERGDVSGLCLCVQDRICAVTAYVIDDDNGICHSELLAVKIGYMRHGFALQLKREVIARSRLRGVRAVISVVHFDNDPMIELNAKLGANIERIPGDTDYVRCIIPLRV